MSQANYSCIYSTFVRLNIYNTCLQAFFDFPWNNFLHSTVEWMIQGILMRKNDQLKVHLLTDCQLLARICTASKTNEEELAKPKGVRKGNMGHITSVSIGVLTAAGSSQAVEKVLTEHEEWNKFVAGALQSTLVKEGKTIEINSRSDEQQIEELDGGNYVEEQFVEEIKTEVIDSESPYIEEEKVEQTESMQSDSTGSPSKSEQMEVEASTN